MEKSSEIQKPVDVDPMALKALAKKLSRITESMNLEDLERLFVQLSTIIQKV